MSMTNEQYVSASGAVCPHCRSGNIRTIGSLEPSGTVIYQSVKCAGCDAEWTDEYTLSGYSEADA